MHTYMYMFCLRVPFLGLVLGKPRGSHNHCGFSIFPGYFDPASLSVIGCARHGPSVPFRLLSDPRAATALQSHFAHRPHHVSWYGGTSITCLGLLARRHRRLCQHHVSTRCCARPVIDTKRESAKSRCQRRWQGLTQSQRQVSEFRTKSLNFLGNHEIFCPEREIHM